MSKATKRKELERRFNSATPEIYNLKKLEYVFFEYNEIVSMLVGKINPREADKDIKITKAQAREFVDKEKLFVRNSGRNGLLDPSGHFIPCNYTGHVVLYAALGFEYTFDNKGIIDLTPDIVGDRFGWFKISDGYVLSVFRPTQKQFDTLHKIEDRGVKLIYKPDEDSMKALSPPPNGYDSFIMKKFSSSRRMDGVNE